MSKIVTIDGNEAAAHVAYAFSDVAAIYPITPSTPMGELADAWAAAGRKNLFGQTLKVAEMQSEAGAAGAIHGSLAAGALTTTFTASQGLLLMIPNMYKMSGELLPAVFHVTARSLAAQALSIFGDHADVYACRQTGFGMLASNSVQEAHDMAIASHLAALESRIPFLHFFDGFRTSHEINKIEINDYDELLPLLDTKKVEEFRARSLNPEHPHAQGTAMNPDTYFQGREAANKFYEVLPEIVKASFDKVEKLTGRRYNLFDYVGASDAQHIIVMMGSGAECAEEAIEHFVAAGEKVGLVKVRLFRPFAVTDFVKVLPKSAKAITVLERSKEPGAAGMPLYQDVLTALMENGMALPVLNGSYGMGSKDFVPSDVRAVLDNMAGARKNHFTVGIVDDVTHGNIPAPKNAVITSPEGTVCCKFFGLGSDGTVGANKNSIKIIGDNTKLFAQGYFEYDSKKSGGMTVSHLRFGKKPIKSTYLINATDFLACSNASYVYKYDMLSSMKEGGIFLLNSGWSTAELETELPAKVKNQIAKKKLKFYNIDALKIAEEAGSAKSSNMVMQAAFFKLSNVIPYADAEKHMKAAIVKSYGKKGEKVVAANNAAVDNAVAALIEVKYPAAWATTTEGKTLEEVGGNEYYQGFMKPILSQKGNELPVSSFAPDGRVPTGTSCYEKRGIAVNVPEWISEKCIQCNMCSFVCPHAVIRPHLLDKSQTAAAPSGFNTIKANGVADMSYRMQVSPLDCTGCGVCVNVCPSAALKNVPLNESVEKEAENYQFSLSLPMRGCDAFKKDSVKGSQFLKPYFEFSGACAGCGETPYIKLVSQLFGDHLLVANATGCSSIYTGSSPSMPYCKDEKGRGTAWANSLFEDNAEFGYGMLLAYTQRRNRLSDIFETLLTKNIPADLKTAINLWLKNKRSYEVTRQVKEQIEAVIDGAIAAAGDGETQKLLKEVQRNSDMIVKKSLWLIGGDGWAYDIGYGGLDHVLAQNEDINVLVLDTEVYSNTGGQASKATPTGSTAKFAAAGKRVKKKDLGMIAMSYGYVYTAQVGLGANMQQTVKAISEAEAYDGPSLVIAYSPCINHGINMTTMPERIKKAVECGYWALYRYNPAGGEDENGIFTLDSKEPSGDYQAFLAGETRYSALSRSKPEVAKVLFELNEKEAKQRIANYKRLEKK